MANDVRVVVPGDIGATIKMGVKETNKYDVDVSQLDLPAALTGLELNDKTLVAHTSDGDKTVDLTPLIPAAMAEVFLKQVERQGNKIVFTVGEQGNTTNDTTLEINVADLLPVQADGRTITGDGTASDKLKVAVSTVTSNNLLKSSDDGLYVSAEDVIAAVPQPETPARDIRLVNASGTTVVGYIHSTER